ncbi:hypothetical protein [Streptomyces malaysiensis]|uniref:Uncharacterized protein n=1 Tax=Streptomyces malaysiensis subsp. samsunensis TaxID=459658 RepID=A0A9X2S0Z3_STRMQ|nr:hypothetical protein [Streptomyces samsunensis]MCQ8835694.1 hypothetical protein [Streptomyces samsunensis]
MLSRCPGVPAEEVFRDATCEPLPELQPPPARPGSPYVMDGHQATGIDAQGLELLIADAAARAHRMLTSALPGDETVTEDLWRDSVRIAASHQDEEIFSRLCTGTGRLPMELNFAVRAWKFGGEAGLDVLERMWLPPKKALDQALSSLHAEWDGSNPLYLRVWGNRITADGLDVQIRLGTGGLWYPYAREHGAWWPCGPTEQLAYAALQSALASSPGMR